jgi:hypothetical protein
MHVPEPRNKKLARSIHHLCCPRSLRTFDKDGAREAYRDFLTLWKDADAGNQVLHEGKAEYEKLQ